MTGEGERAVLIEGALRVTAAEPATERVSILIDGGRVTEVGPTAGAASIAPPRGARRFDAHGLMAAPGFIDLQLNGAAGHDLTREPEAIWTVGTAVARYGVTAFLPTLVSPGWDVVGRARAVWLAGAPAGYAGAVPLGWHVEGPFLSPVRAGAHDPAALRSPDPAAVDGWSPESGIRLVTLAPELPGAIEVVRALVARGVVVSAGHSAATFAEAVEGFDAGVRCATHLFNAMGPLDRREPGLVGAALADGRVTVCLIPDGIHVHRAVVALVRATVGVERLAIVSDAIEALGMAPGIYRLAGRDVIVDGTSARLHGGVLAGSVLPFDEGVRNLAWFCGLELAACIPAATTVPARLLALAPERGSLMPGARADVTLMGPALNVVLTIAGGRVVHDATDGSRWA